MSEFDLVIFGATGFTGQLAARELARSGESLRVAIAGRNKAKLEALRSETSPGFGIIVADSSDTQSIEAMVQKAKVVLSFAGPYALYGEPVIRACVKYGKDYLDITGESPFIRTMIDRYQEEAMQTGSRLVPFSGFDSVPADIVAHLALKAAEKFSIQLDAMEFHYKIKGGFNGGTLETAMNLAESSATKELLDGNILIPDKAWPRSPSMDFAARYQPTLKRWTAPFLMGAVNRAVVRRSLYLKSKKNQQQSAVGYEERHLMGRRLGVVQAGVTTGFLAGFGLVTQAALGRQLVRKFGPKPGEGPSEKSRVEGFFQGTLLGSSHNKNRVIVKMERKGDPGNEITVALALASAKLAVNDDFEDGAKGFLTPTTAFGDRLKPALEEAGFRFVEEVVDIDRV